MTDEHYNILEYERTILSSIIFEPEHRDKLFEDLNKKDFSSVAHRDIFEACLNLEKRGLPIEDEFIKTELVKTGKWDEMAYIVAISVLPTDNIDAYKKVIKEYSRNKEYRLEMALVLDKTKELSIDEVNAQVKKLADKFESEGDISNSEFDISCSADIIPTKAEFFYADDIPIQKNEVNLFSGAGGIGKSFLNLYLLARISKNHKKRVFGFFSEDPKGITANRIKILENLHEKLDFSSVFIGGKSSVVSSFVMRDRNGLPVESPYFGRFKKAMRDYEIILIDPLIAFFGLEENSNSEIRYYMNLLNKWCDDEDKTILMIHHHSKGGESRGASALIDAVRMHYEVGIGEVKTDAKEKPAESKNEYRYLKLLKRNHWSGKNDFKVKLFGKSEMSTGVEIVYEGGEEVAKAPILKDEGILPTHPKKWENSIENFMED